jgi:ABC-2 type transport system permease protein
MTAVAAPAWFARHEVTLVWRDFVSMMAAGKRSRERVALVVALFIGAGLHALAWPIASLFAADGLAPERGTLVVLTGTAFLCWTLMLSQALESVTRAFYARADLDLILSSPVSAGMVFAIRIGAITLGTIGLSALLFGPFVNVLAFQGGLRWLGAYGVLVAMGAAAVALAVALTVLMFRWIGPKRTRLLAQIVAAVVGAAFVIGVQAVAIVSYGTLSRSDALRSDLVLSLAPGIDSVAWLPARAAMGDGTALLAVLWAGLALLAGSILLAAPRFATDAIAAAGLPGGETRAHGPSRLRSTSGSSALRRKEWVLLARDPWLVSQSLMQLLYLIPPALLLWRSYGADTGQLTLLPPVIVMAAGQLAGGLAWLAISGEDAPDLVASAPVSAGAVLRAKIESVLAVIAVITAPLVVAIALASAWIAMATLAGVLAAAASATSIQMLFRAQARRSHFRRRQTSSRIATLAEALASISWAAAAGLAAAGSPAALAPAMAALAVLAATARFAPRPS